MAVIDPPVSSETSIDCDQATLDPSADEKKEPKHIVTEKQHDDAGKQSKTAFSRRQYLQIFSVFFIFFSSWGLLLSFGVLQTYYELELLPDRSSSDIAWISTLCTFLLLLSGTVTGSLYDRGWHKALLVSGSLIQTLGFMLLSLSTRYYQILLSQGVVLGLGGGLLFVPSVAAAATSFDASVRGRVMGLVATGSGIGGVVYPILLRHLIQNLGFAWAIRVIGFIVLGTYLVSWCILPFKQKKPSNVRRLIDVSALRDVPFLSMCAAAFLSGCAYYIPLLFLPLFAQSQIPGLDGSNLTFYILSIVNGSSVIGRLLAGAAADRYGPLEVNAMARVASGVVLLCWIAVRSVAGIVVWSIAWGLATSAIVSLPGAIVPLLCPHPGVIGSRTGMYWAGNAVGFLIGGPISAALAGGSGQGAKVTWWHLQIFAGLIMSASVVFCVHSMIALRGATRAKQAATVSQA